MKSINERNSGMKGFTLLEVLIAIFVAVLIGMASVSLLSIQAVGIDDRETVQRAETSAEDALSALTAIAPDLTAGGSFAAGSSDLTVGALGQCSSQTCDYVLASESPEEQRNSPAKGSVYGSSSIGQTDIFFLRRWRVEDINANYGLRKITVAVFKDERTAEPITVETSIVGISR